MTGPQLHELDDSLPGISLSLNPSEEYEPSSTLQYVNSQLVAHGFTRAPGLSIDGISNEDGQKLVKCLMTMLSQRMEDVGQTEQLGSKLRTISYENERLQSFNKAEQEKAANAEREMTLFKSKLTASQRSHTAEVAAHKQTAAESQRHRTALQYLRTTTQNELKRKEKELERTLERWSKICDSQAKLGATGTGLCCASLAAPCEQLLSKGMMEEALEQAEEARVELMKENEGFRSVLLGTAHALQTIAHNVKKQDQDAQTPELSLLTPTAIFAPPTSCLTHPENAHLKIKELITNLKDAVADAQQRDALPATEAILSDQQVTKMQQTIDSLRLELDALRNNKTKAQAVFDQYTKYISGQKRERGLQETLDLMSDTELDKRSKELEIERKKFTEATIKLGHERSELETERRRLFEEKRRWEADRILAELPPNSSNEDPDLIPSPKRSFTAKPASPKRHGIAEYTVKSLKRGGITKSPAKKKSKVTFKGSKASSSQRPKTKSDGKPPKEVENFHESEDKHVFQSVSSQPLDSVEAKRTLPELFPRALESRIQRHPPRDCKPTMPLVLPTSFTLPPPSPGSLLSLQPLIIPTSSSLTEFPPPNVPASSTPIPSTSASISTAGPSTSAAAPTSTSAPASSSSNFDKIPLISSPPTIPSVPSRPIRGFPSPRTPRTLLNVGLNGMKKHDYSPAKPSPLSRILMIADSPSSPDEFMGTIEEEEEEEDGIKEETLKPGNTEKSKAIQLDFGANVNLPPMKTEAVGTYTKKPAAKDKKTRSESKAATTEKENVGVILSKTNPATNETTAKAKVKETSTTAVSKTKSKSSTTITKTEATSQGQMVKPGGARRVPLGVTGAGKVSSGLL